MDDIRAALAEATELLARVAPTSLASATDDALCTLLADAERLGRLVDAVRVFTAAEVEARSGRERGQDGLAQRHGFIRGAQFVEHLARVPQAEAVRRVRLGEAVRGSTSLGGAPLPPEYPAVAAALSSGQIGTDCARIIVASLAQAAPSALLDDVRAAEQALVEQALLCTPDLVAVHARAWREALDPDGAEPREEAIRRRRAFRLGREVGGLTPFSGQADPTFAALLRSALSEGSGSGVLPRFLDAADREAGTESLTTPDGEVVERLRDPRSREQRQHDILAGLITAGIRVAESGAVAPMRPLSAVTAVIRLEDLKTGRGVGWLDDVLEPVSAATIHQLACDGGVRPLVLGDDGEILHLGRTQRLFSAAQRRALAVRDGGCVWPGCTAPPGWCQAHHVAEWEHGGATDIDNGALLCSAHHHMLHASEFTMRMIRGRPRLLAPPWLDPEQIWRTVGRSRVTVAA